MRLPRLVGNTTRRLARWLMRLYYPTIEVSHRERIPARGAVLFVANHPNSLLDPPLIGWTARRPVHFFAKAPLFDVPVFGAVLHALGMVPAYRGSDDPRQVRRNLDTLRAGADFLVKGEAVGLFPEGKSHDLNRVEMIRSGAARLALQAGADGAAVQIVPLGLNHERKERFRSSVWVRVGRPIDAASILREHGGEERRALRHLTAEIERRLKEVVVHLEEPQWQPFLNELELLLPPARGKAESPIAALRQRKLIADAMNHWLAADRPRAEAMAAAIERHRRELAAAGLSMESRVFRQQGAASAWHAGRELFWLLVGAVPAAAGAIHHLVPFTIVRLLARGGAYAGRAWMATRRLLWSLPLYAAWYAVVWWMLAQGTQPRLAWLWTALMPLAGIITWHYGWRAEQTVRLLWQEGRMLLRPGHLRRLRADQCDLRQQLLAFAEAYLKVRALEVRMNDQAQPTPAPLEEPKL